eukprot:jgi/Galph1/4487/GphlegSOOS_G3151.1
MKVAKTLFNSVSQHRSFSLKAIVEDLIYRLKTRKIFRPDLADYVQHYSETKSDRFHHQLEGGKTPLVPQGPYKQVFDIQYYSRDARRVIRREEVESVKILDPEAEQLPPVPGRARIYKDRGYVPNRGDPTQAEE